MRTETVEMDRGERVEMMVAIYDSADTIRRHDLRTHAERQQPLEHTGSASVKIRKHRAAKGCLHLLCFLLLTTVIGLFVHFITERNQLLTHISNLTEEREQIMEHNNNLTEEREQILNQNNNLTEEREQIFINNTKLIAEKEHLLKENKILSEKIEQTKDKTDELIRGLLKQDQQADNFKWIYYNFSFYYISSEWKSWSDSKLHCQQRGAVLVIINSQKEQDFLQKIAVSDYFWIGLQKMEGVWEWIGGAKMVNRYWKSQYPRSHNAYCALMTSEGWVDEPCTKYKRWICKSRILKSLHNINMYIP